MTNTTFSTVVANNLEDITMIAGDEQSFIYTVYDESQSLFDLTTTTCTVEIFKYGAPSTLLLTLTGVVTSGKIGEFIANFPSSDSASFSGVYQQQPKIVDYLGGIHIPAQGKIIIFPSP